MMADRLDIQLVSAALRRLGWIRFWAQVVLAVVVMGVLLFNNIGGHHRLPIERKAEA